MEFISSDSNIWLDFNAINRLDAPFLIKDIYTFLISRDTLEDELITPIDLGEKLTSYGLIKTAFLFRFYSLVCSTLLSPDNTR